MSNLKQELLQLPESIRDLQNELEQLHYKIKTKELKLERLRSKAMLELRSVKDMMKMTKDVMDARTTVKFHLKQINLVKLKHKYRVRAIELEHLINRFSALKKIAGLEDREWTKV